MTVDEVNDIADAAGLDLVQLSGGETQGYHRAHRHSPSSVPSTSPNGETAFDVFDAIAAGRRRRPDARYRFDAARGGTGEAFDWDVAAEVARRTPFLLAGGLTPENVGRGRRDRSSRGASTSPPASRPTARKTSRRSAPSSARRRECALAADTVLNPRFGEFGGRYIPEVLVGAHEELEAAYIEARADPTFQAELDDLNRALRRPAHAALLRRTPDRRVRRRAASGSSAKTSPTRAPTRSTTPSARRCSPGAWASRASSPRPAPASTASPPPPSAPCWASNAPSTWAARTSAASRSTSSA